MSKQATPCYIVPTFRFTRYKKTPHTWTVLWSLGGQAMEAIVHPNDQAYIEANYDVEVDKIFDTATHEFLILKTKPATAPEKEGK